MAENLSEETAAEVSFNPPLYIQRYNMVTEFIKNVHGKKVVDMGCSECNLLKRLKMLECVQSVIGVDIDEVLLETNKWKVQPLNSDYLVSQQRTAPFTVQLLLGSVIEADARLLGTDVFCLVEVIEHLDKAVLAEVPDTVFGILKPKHVIVSTPNADYNVLFPNFAGRRHWDHKFEWTRSEFVCWCDEICRVYSYSVEYSGLGDPSPAFEHVGFCTQVAFFTQNSHFPCGKEQADDGVLVVYKEIAKYVFPFSPEQPPDKKLLNELQYYVHYLARLHEQEEREPYTENGIQYIAISFEELLKFSKIRKLCSSSDTPVQHMIKIIEEDSGLLLNSTKSCILVQDQQDVEDTCASCDYNGESPGEDDTFTHAHNYQEGIQTQTDCGWWDD